VRQKEEEIFDQGPGAKNVLKEGEGGHGSPPQRQARGEREGAKGLKRSLKQEGPEGRVKPTTISKVYEKGKKKEGLK